MDQRRLVTLGSRRGWPSRPGRTVACAKGAVNRPHPGLSSARTEGFNRRYDYQRLRFSGGHSAILALIQLFELWKSLTAFPGATSSSRRVQILLSPRRAGPAILMLLALSSRRARDYAVRGRRMPKKLTPSRSAP
jgi:hypothetical protein